MSDWVLAAIVFFAFFTVTFAVLRLNRWRVVQLSNGCYGIKRFNWRKLKYETYVPDFSETQCKREDATDE